MMLWHMTRLLSTLPLCMPHMKSILNLLYSLFNSSIGHKVRKAKWIHQAKVLARSFCLYIFCCMVYRWEPTLWFPHAPSSGLWISIKLSEHASPLFLNKSTSLVRVHWDVCHMLEVIEFNTSIVCIHMLERLLQVEKLSAALTWLKAGTTK
jgi:hypothetical protein